MRHDPLSDGACEAAALYALGALDAASVAAFEAHLAEGCAACAREVASAARVGVALAQAARAVEPPPALRDRLVARIAGRPRIVRSTEGAWQAGPAGGSQFKRLGDPGDRLTLLVRLAPGGHIPDHHHADTEELYMLNGDLVVEGRTLGPGDYCAALADTVHRRSHSASGCSLLVRRSRRDRPLAEGASASPRGLHFIMAAEAVWATARDGVSVRSVFADPARGSVTAVVRLPSGAQIDGGRCLAGAELYVLDGDAELAHGQALAAGDYCAADDERDAALARSRGGGTVLVMSSRSLVPA